MQQELFRVQSVLSALLDGVRPERGMKSARQTKYLNETWFASTGVMEGSVLGLWRGRLRARGRGQTAMHGMVHGRSWIPGHHQRQAASGKRQARAVSGCRSIEQVTADDWLHPPGQDSVVRLSQGFRQGASHRLHGIGGGKVGFQRAVVAVAPAVSSGRAAAAGLAAEWMLLQGSAMSVS